MINNGSINPVGGTLDTLDVDYFWKRKKHIVGTSPAANQYNLVQLKSVEGKRKFTIEQSLPEPSDSMHSLLKDTAECKKGINQSSTVTFSAESCVPKPKYTQSPCNQHVVSNMPHSNLLPMAGSIPEIIKGEEPHYVNTMKSPTHSLATVTSESSEYVTCESERYENWPSIELQKDVSSDKSDTPVYIDCEK